MEKEIKEGRRKQEWRGREVEVKRRSEKNEEGMKMKRVMRACSEHIVANTCTDRLTGSVPATK